jgi:hypothetical protein
MARTDPEPICELCAKPMRPGQSVLFHEGKCMHLGCGSRAAIMRAATLEAEAQAARAHAARVSEIARVILESRHGPRTGDPADPAA